jgi:hypothetical protein
MSHYQDHCDDRYRNSDSYSDLCAPGPVDLEQREESLAEGMLALELDPLAPAINTRMAQQSLRGEVCLDGLSKRRSCF